MEKTNKTKITQIQENAGRKFKWQKTHNILKILNCDIIIKNHDHKFENGGYIIKKLPRGGNRIVIILRNKINPNFFTCETVRKTIKSNKIFQIYDAARKNLNIISLLYQKLKKTSPFLFILLFIIKIPIGKIFNIYIYRILFNDSDKSKTGTIICTIVRYTESEIIAQFNRDVTQNWLHKWCLVTG